MTSWYNAIYPSSYTAGDRVLITELEAVQTIQEHIEDTAGDADNEATVHG